jgi:hypothetical protein
LRRWAKPNISARRPTIQELAEMGAKAIVRADEWETVRAILSIIAIAKGLRTHGKFLVEYSEAELLEMEL